MRVGEREWAAINLRICYRSKFYSNVKQLEDTLTYASFRRYTVSVVSVYVIFCNPTRDESKLKILRRRKS